MKKLNLRHWSASLQELKNRKYSLFINSNTLNTEYEISISELSNDFWNCFNNVFVPDRERLKIFSAKYGNPLINDICPLSNWNEYVLNASNTASFLFADVCSWNMYANKYETSIEGLVVCPNKFKTNKGFVLYLNESKASNKNESRTNNKDDRFINPKYYTEKENFQIDINVNITFSSSGIYYHSENIIEFIKFDMFKALSNDRVFSVCPVCNHVFFRYQKKGHYCHFCPSPSKRTKKQGAEKANLNRNSIINNLKRKYNFSSSDEKEKLNIQNIINDELKKHNDLKEFKINMNKVKKNKKR